jgi:F-type H+-transporting ATPase subunit a
VSSPLQQFEIHSIVTLPPLAGLDVSFTNSSLFMVLAAVFSLALVTLTMRQRALIPGRWQALAEMYYGFIAGLVKETATPEAKRFFPFIFTLFSFILFGNLLGMLPFSFTFTSHIIVTFAMAAFIFVLVTIVGFVRHGTHFFSYFLPEGTPLLIAPLLFVLEVFAYLTRPFTLSVRLFANMLAGHVLLKVIISFVAMMGVAGVVPLLATVAFIGFEVFVACLQAYIFSLLTCVYLKDAIHLH